MKANGSKVDRYTVAWRRGSVFAEVIGGGLSGRVDVADVVALAKKQDSRIAKALQLSQMRFAVDSRRRPRIVSIVPLAR